MLLLILVSGGCADPYTITDYRRDLATLHCARMRDCCTVDEYTDWWTGALGPQHCEAVWENGPGSLAVDDALDADKLAFDPVAAHACLDALSVQACSEFEPAYRYRETYCASSLHGLVHDGDGCQADVECASTHCLPDPSQGRDVCVPGTATGAPCDNTHPCDRPDACQLDGLCGRGRPAGESCEVDDDCIDHWCQVPARTRVACVSARATARSRRSRARCHARSVSACVGSLGWR